MLSCLKNISFSLPFFCLFAVSAASHVFAADSSSEQITYKLEDFEGSRFPLTAVGSGGADEACSLETEKAHDGKRGVLLEWNGFGNKNITNPWTKSNYVYFWPQGGAVILGAPESISMWVYAEAALVNTPLRIIVTDVSGEIFSTETKVTHAGWNKLIFKIAELTAGEPNNGDHNKRVDLPAALAGLIAGEVGSKGTLILDDIEVTTHGDARSLVQTKIIPLQEGGDIAWGQAPGYRFDVINYSASEIKTIVANITVKDGLNGKIAWEKRIEIPSVLPQQTVSVPLTFDVPNGVYDLKWEAHDPEGPLSGGGDKAPSIRLGRMAGDNGSQSIGSFEKKYVENWGLIGGIFWSTPPSLAKKTGAAWERLGCKSTWNLLETEKGKIDVSLAVKAVKEDRDLGLGIVYLNSIYNQPSFYSTDQEQFAPKFGLLHAREAEACGDMVNCWELGNEDNGTAKFIWSEIARNGAAGVRSKSATAMIGTTGTASIDVNFMRLQANRGLFDRLDALITHPYTWASSPEAYGLDNQFDQIDQVIDDLGGMKIQMTTEFGYSENFDQLKRAQWVPRNYAIGAAAGLYRHGVYAFNQEFGLYSGIDPYPVAETLNTYGFMTYGYHFAGWFEKNAGVWAAAFDKGAETMVMAWSPSGTGQLQVPLAAGKDLKIRDMFGNAVSLPAPSADGKSMAITVSESPIYITDLDPSALATSYDNELKRAQARYQRCLAASELKDVPTWKALGEGDAPISSSIRQALLAWQPQATPVTKVEKAVIAQALRWLVIGIHAEAAAGKSDSVEADDLRSKWVSRLKSSVSDDVDLPDLRWLLHNWDETRDEMTMVKELGNKTYAGQLASLEQVYDHLADRLTDGGTQVFFPVWPYLHAPAVDGKLVERIVFVPGKGVPVKVRLHSYSSHPYEGEVRLELPSGWKVTPASWKGKIDPLSSQEFEFSVTAGNESSAKSITAVLTVPGKPVVRIPFDDFSVLPPLEIKVPVLSKLLPGAPLPLQLVNNGDVPLGANVRLVEKANTPAIARARVADIAPGETRNIELTLPTTMASPAFNEWKLLADLTTTDGKNFQVPLSIDFNSAVRAKLPPTIDGDLGDWKDTAPLHIDQEAYTWGSYPTGWSKEDESGVAYTQWDDQNFYIALHVSDQTFHQDLGGADVWGQDSVQFCLVGPNNQRHQFSLALTPQGPQIWSDLKGALVTDGQLKVVLKPGEAFYEAAIPWSALPGIKPTIGETFRFDVALNDDDYIVKRRYMERYGIGIVGATANSDALGYLHLGEEAPETAPPFQEEAANSNLIFSENFEEYNPGETPDTWTVAGASNGMMHSWVKTGIGVNGSKCLELIHTEPQQGNVYLSLTRPLTGLTVGKKYRLSFKVKGSFSCVPGSSPLVVGTCLDNVGSIGYNWPAAWTPSDQWQEVSMDWTSVGGDLRVIILNDVEQTKSLLIDDIKVTEIP